MMIFVIHPTIRPEKALAAFRLWKERATGKDWSYSIVVDADFPVPVSQEVEWVVSPGKGSCQALNYGAWMARSEIIVCAADDLIPPQGWDTAIIDRIGDTSKSSVLAVNDGLRKDFLLTHPILTRQRFVEQENMVVAREYDEASGLYADNEFTEKAYRDGVVIEARDLLFKHDHPSLSGNVDAEIFEHNSMENYAKGAEIFEKRNPHAGFGKIAFGVRVTQIDNSFFWCWSRLLLSSSKRPSDVVLNFASEMPHGPAMNILLHWFLRTDCESLLVIDDDMEFTPDVVDKLRMTPGCDVITPLMCCRRSPHGPLVLGEWDANKNCPTPILPSKIKGIVPVQYVGLGFTLIKRWVLEAMIQSKPNEVPFVFDPMKAEDGKFSEDVRKAGGKLSVNSNVRVGHRFAAAVYWNKQDCCPEYSENDYGRSLYNEK